MKRNILLIILLLCLTVGVSGAASAFTEIEEIDALPNTPGVDAVVSEKDEVIYARLASDGTVGSAYAVSHFVVTEAGVLGDSGDFSEVTNLTDLQPLRIIDGGVSGGVSAGDFYYQGTLKTPKLPWTYGITYRLDGAETAPEELAGKSGALEISIQTTAGGGVFTEHYLQQITVTLANERCSNIEAAGASVAGAGKNRILSFTVLPGSDADLLIKADVKDFEMPGIDISALPFSMEVALPDTSELTGQFSRLAEAVSGIDHGIKGLADGAGQLSESASLLASMAAADPVLGGALAELAGGIESLQQGLAELSEGSGALAAETGALPERIADEVESLMSGFTGGEFTPVSFLSEKNEKIQFVQFVFQTEGIAKPQEKAPDQDSAEDESFWDRLMNLFEG
ncbi:MAG: hypothetical protein LBR72_03140 [Oscillospiraceae bacterium]|nr:hypothetical protein [Oscillospiraceae bacterium]